MSFKDIQLPDILLADLYRTDIIAVENPKKITVKTEDALDKIPVAAVKKYLGDNLKKTTVLVNDPDNLFIDDESLSFLTKMLGACNLNIADVAIVNLAHSSIDSTFLQQTLQPQHCIMFGVSTQDIGLPFTIPMYQVQNFSNCKYTIAPPTAFFLNDDENATAEKRKLWASLKKMFSL